MIPKFRAFWKSEKKTIYVDWIRFGNKDLIGKVDGQTILPVGFEDVVLMQSTGLFDANGKEIFEGDVATFEDFDYAYPDFVYVNRGVIEYAAPTFHITNRNSTEMEDLLDGNFLDVIVLGNIHEHPELVEEVEI